MLRFVTDCYFSVNFPWPSSPRIPRVLPPPRLMYGMILIWEDPAWEDPARRVCASASYLFQARNDAIWSLNLPSRACSRQTLVS